MHWRRNHKPGLEVSLNQTVLRSTFTDAGVQSNQLLICWWNGGWPFSALSRDWHSGIILRSSQAKGHLLGTVCRKTDHGKQKKGGFGLWRCLPFFPLSARCHIPQSEQKKKLEAEKCGQKHTLKSQTKQKWNLQKATRPKVNKQPKRSRPMFQRSANRSWLRRMWLHQKFGTQCIASTQLLPATVRSFTNWHQWLNMRILRTAIVKCVIISVAHSLAGNANSRLTECKIAQRGERSAQ